MTSRWTRITALLILPWVFVLIDSSWLYSPPGSLDPWLYHGFMRNYPAYIGGLFPDTYYGTRLGWIVPGFLVYAAFPATLANVVLHIGLFYAAVFGAYVLLAALTSSTTAFFGALMLGASPPMLVALGWDYVDGAVIAYLLTATAAAVRAAQSRRPVMSSLVSGAALGCMVHTNAVGVLLLPAVATAFVMVAPHDWTHRGRAVAFGALGALTATALLAAVNVAAGGFWPFFMPSVTWGLSATSGSPARDVFHFPNVVSLALPATAIVATCASLATKQWQRPELALGAATVCAAATMAAFDLSGGALLSTQYYISWLVPLAVCTAAAVCLKNVAHLGPRGLWLAAIVIAAAGAIGIHGGEAGRIGFDSNHAGPLIAVWSVVGFALLGLTVAVAANRGGSVTVGAWIVLFAASTALAGRSMVVRPDPTSKDLFVAVDQVLTLVKTNDPLKRPLFWYGPSPLVNDFRSIVATHLFGYSLIGESYPALPADATAEARYRTRILPGRRVAILAADPVDESRLHSEFAQQGLDVAITSVNRISAGRIHFLLTILEVLPAGDRAATKSTLPQ